VSDPELISVYTDEIIALAEKYLPGAHLENPDASGSAVSPICGSTAAVDVKLSGGTVSALVFSGESCALARACAAIVREEAPGADAAEVEAGLNAFRALLAEGTPIPQGRWQRLTLFTPVRAFPARHNALLLPLVALVRALR
jgi:NifU-like protein involved in Fe-S cluster formation